MTRTVYATDRRASRLIFRRQLTKISRLPRFKRCGWAPHGRSQVGLGLQDGHAGVVGVTACGSIHVCPCCAPVIREQRAADIQLATAEWLRRGGQVLWATFTLPHGLGDGLADSWAAVQLAYSEMWKRLRHVIGSEFLGQIRVVEQTYGKAGWHPHIHALWFVSTDVKLPTLLEAVGPLWRNAVEGAGWRRPEPSVMTGEFHDVKISRLGLDPAGAVRLARYCAKVRSEDETWGIGRELSRGDVKKGRSRGRTPMEIGRDAVAGDAQSVTLWREYEQASRGRNAIRWSPKLRVFLLAGVRELSDEEIVSRAQLVLRVALTPRGWRVLRKLPAALAVALELLEADRLDVLGDLLADLGVTVAEWVDPD